MIIEVILSPVLRVFADFVLYFITGGQGCE